MVVPEHATEPFPSFNSDSHDSRIIESLATEGMSLHSKQSTLVVAKQQSLPAELLEQGLDPSVLELNNLLLTQIHETAEGNRHDVQWLEQKKHVRPRSRLVSGANG